MRSRQREFLERARGVLVSLPSPFRRQGLDLDAFDALVEFHARRAARGVLLAGATGEGSTLRRGEREELVLHASLVAARAARDDEGGSARARLLIVAAVGTDDTRQSVELARDALAAGADALLVTTPYYVRPSRHGLLRHLGGIAEHTADAPLLLHNDPQRTGLDLEPEVVREVSSLVPSIVALVESHARPARVRRVVEDSGLAVFGGVDRMLAPFAAHGAEGALSVVANLVPDEVDGLLAASRPGSDPADAQRLELALAPLIDALAIESDPGPIKAALASLGAAAAEVRAPLAELEPDHRRSLEQALAAARLLVPG